MRKSSEHSEAPADVGAERHFRRVRFALGAFLFVHFAHLLPWAPEVFSSAGMLSDGDASPLLHLFANPLALFDSPLFTQLFVGSGAFAALVLAAGRGTPARFAAFYLWFVLACLFGRNPLIRNPSLPYVGVLLLTYAASKERPDVTLVRVVWVLLAVGYAYSGLTKLASPSWLDGSAVAGILQNPLARPSALRDVLLGLPSDVLAALSYGTLALEIAFPLFALSRRARPFVWLAMTGLHLSLLVLIDFADLTWGMLLLHAFTFDPRWWPRSAILRLVSSRHADSNHRHAWLHGRVLRRLFRVDQEAHGQSRERQR